MPKKFDIKLIVLMSFLLIFLVIGSFFDYEIANEVYYGQHLSDNFLGILFSYIGIIPTFVGWSFLGSSILFLRNKQCSNKIHSKLLLALGIFLLILSFLYFCNTIMLVNEKAFDVPWFIAYSIGLISVIAAAYLGYIFAKKSDNIELLNKILFLVVVSLITMVITMITKEIMARPRFRFVQEMNNYEYFKNWWQSGHEIKQSLNSNALSDEFSSFPSGHSSFSMFAIFIFPLFADYNKKIEKYRVGLFVLGVIWWAFTAFSRLTVGAHYLSDVCFGGFFTIIAYLIVVFINTIISRRKRNINLTE